MNPTSENKSIAEPLELWPAASAPASASPSEAPAEPTLVSDSESRSAPTEGPDEPAVEDDIDIRAEEPPAMPPTDWKAALRADFERWLDALDEIPDPGGAQKSDAPDLYAFYEQLAQANVESRKANRRTAAAFSQWGETLAKFDGELRLLRDHLARQSTGGDDALPRPWALALVEIVDRLRRLAAAFAGPPDSTGWLGALRADAPWRRAWDTQRQGFDILLGHVETLLKKAGITRIVTLHEPFDPGVMSAVATEPNSHWPAQTVLEEMAAGYRFHGDLLRVAQVKVSTLNPQ